MSKYTGPDPSNLDEHYRTDPWVVHRLLEKLSDEQRLAFRGHCVSPCAGDGAIVQAVNTFFGPGYVQRWTMIEKQPRFTQALLDLVDGAPPSRTTYHLKFASDTHKVRESYTTAGTDYNVMCGNALLLTNRLRRPAVSVVIDNPPFSRALAFYKKYRPIAPGGLYFLLRTSWLETVERHEYLQHDMPDVYLLPQRPSFVVEGGTDAASYSWMHWGVERKPVATIRLCNLTPKDER